ncbi:MAG: TlpA family protein disulfide reductase, partial [Planctomycetaceae bacterium]|nr:TlpA family protein disulfide reductase [Planctomycetaceae bacterium]
LSPEDAGPAPQGQSEDPMPTTESPVEAAAVDAQILDWDGVEALVRSHKGKVVVMDLWSTYCLPCRKEFPNLVNLHKEHGDQVACISVSLDFDGLEDQPVEACREKVLKFLTDQGATFDNVVCSTPAETVFDSKIPHKSVPAVYVFDKEGNWVGKFPNLDEGDPEAFNYPEHVLPLVTQLLAQ